MGMERKSVHAELKQAGDEGAFEAVIATFGVVDSDGDVVERDAFSDRPSAIVPAHDQGSVPLGKGAVEVRGNQAVAVGRFNLKVPAGKNWHEAIKFDLEHPPAVQEWSWGYFPTKFRFEERDGKSVRVLEAVDLIEISPVLRGASVGTGTLSAKSASPRHETETSDGVWDQGEQLRRLKGSGEMFALGKSFPHHFVEDDGGVGAASVRACLAGIAALNGVRGATELGDEDRKGVHAHLAGHLKDAGVEAPELQEQPGIKLSHQVLLATWDAEAAMERVLALAKAREKGGKALADDRRAEAIGMATAIGELRRLDEKLSELVELCKPEDQVALAVAAWEVSRARSVLGG